MNLLYCAISSYSSNEIYFSYNCGTMPKELHHDSKSLFSKFKSLNSKINERTKLTSNYGCWFLLHDSANRSYAVCCSLEYPERSAFALIEELKVEISKTEIKNRKNDKQLQNICEKYLHKADKVQEAQKHVNGLKNDLNMGISRMMQNKEELEEMEVKSVKMKALASEFNIMATEIESITFWHKWKLYIMVGCIIAAFLLIMGLIIFSKVH